MYLYCKRRPYLSPAQHRHMRLGLGVSPRTVLAFYEPHISGGSRLAEGQLQIMTKRDGRVDVRRAPWDDRKPGLPRLHFSVAFTVYRANESLVRARKMRRLKSRAI